MHPFSRALVQAASELFELEEPIVELGSRLVAGQERIADLRGLFPGREYVGCDAISGPGVDRIEDVERLSFETGSVPSVLCLNTLEHVRNPLAAMQEISRVVAPGGVALVHSLFCTPIHEFPRDFWRFTPASFAEHLGGFRCRIVGWCGPEDIPVDVYAVGFKRAVEDLEGKARALRDRARALIGRRPSLRRRLRYRLARWLARGKPFDLFRFDHRGGVRTHES